MRIAILSDIHSNIYALDAVLKHCLEKNAEHYFILGDFFGYYPWAVEVYQRIKTLRDKATLVIGNHDDYILNPESVKKEEYYSEAIFNNIELLQTLGEEPFEWLHQLSNMETVKVGKCIFTLVHGTPDDPLKGRYYPDNKKTYPWFPEKDHFLLMGQTHYPLIRKTEEGGYLLNPGSVGQPRDGNPVPSWMMVDAESLEVTLFRTPYDHAAVVELLKKMEWEPKAIAQLSK